MGNLNISPMDQGRITIISGPVRSNKKQRIKVELDSLKDCGYKNGKNVLVFRHPADEYNNSKEVDHIGNHNAIVTDSVDEIYNNIFPETKIIFIVGASHYKDSRIIDLADGIVRSNRHLVASGLNLDFECKPHDYMPGLMSLADEIFLQKADHCFHPCCKSNEANRSIKEGDIYKPACTHHAVYPNSPPIPEDQQGYLGLYVGPMYSGKTTAWHNQLEKIQNAGLETVIFKYIKDNRKKPEDKLPKLFSIGDITLHNDDVIKAVNIKDANNIKKFLERNVKIREIFIDEIQFIEGIYQLSLDLLPQGYHIYGAGLPRGFNRKPFGELPALMCLADDINMNKAYCIICHGHAYDNQRMKKKEGLIRPAHISDPLEAIGWANKEGLEYFYQARCLEHWKLLGEPENPFYLERHSR